MYKLKYNWLIISIWKQHTERVDILFFNSIYISIFLKFYFIIYISFFLMFAIFFLLVNLWCDNLLGFAYQQWKWLWTITDSHTSCIEYNWRHSADDLVVASQPSLWVFKGVFSMSMVISWTINKIIKMLYFGYLTTVMPLFFPKL